MHDQVLADGVKPAKPLHRSVLPRHAQILNVVCFAQSGAENSFVTAHEAVTCETPQRSCAAARLESDGCSDRVSALACADQLECDAVIFVIRSVDQQADLLGHMCDHHVVPSVAVDVDGPQRPADVRRGEVLAPRVVIEQLESGELYCVPKYNHFNPTRGGGLTAGPIESDQKLPDSSPADGAKGSKSDPIDGQKVIRLPDHSLPLSADLSLYVVKKVKKVKKSSVDTSTQRPPPSTDGSDPDSSPPESECNVDNTPSKPKVKPLKEIHSVAVMTWKADRLAQAASKRAKAIIARLKKGDKLDVIAKKEKLEVKTSKAFTRLTHEAQSGVPAALSEKLFALKVGDSAMAESPKGYVVGVLASVSAGTGKEKTAVEKGVLREIRQGIAADLSDQLVGAFRQRFTIKTYPNLLRDRL